MGFLYNFRINPENDSDLNNNPNTYILHPTVKPWEKGYKISNLYEIVDIKKGGMGVVYIAREYKSNGLIAIKTFQDKFLWDNNAIQRFMAEAEVWIAIEHHANIVFANTIRIVEGKPLLFLEYVPGGDLDRFIGKIDIKNAMDFAIQFLDRDGLRLSQIWDNSPRY